jgi:hypothetical protein
MSWSNIALSMTKKKMAKKTKTRMVTRTTTTEITRLRAMGTANAGSPGSGGSAAKSLRADGSCSQLAEQSQFDGSM